MATTPVCLLSWPNSKKTSPKEAMKILESSVDPMGYFSANLCPLSIIVVGLLAVGDFGSPISVFKQPF